MSRQYQVLYLTAFVLFAVGVALLGFVWFSESQNVLASTSSADSPTQIEDQTTTTVTTSSTVNQENQASAVAVIIANVSVPSDVGATPTPLPTITPTGNGEASIAQTTNETSETAASSDETAASSEGGDEAVVVVAAEEADAPPPTAVPEPVATATPVPSAPELTGPSWLQYLNLFRAQGGVAFVSDNERWSGNSFQHSQYMVANTTATHGENEGASYYTNGGRAAGVNGNIAIAGWAAAPEVWSIDYWISAPFHAIPLLDPHLHTVGYGVYTDPNTSFQQGGTMQYKTGLADHLPDDIEYPLTFPMDGGKTWVLSHRNPEFPDPMDSCPGYQRPTGPPIMIQLGAGSLTPQVASSKVLRNGSEEVPHCVIHEANFVSSNSGLQRSGRSILNTRDAVILMPATPFKVGESYSVEISVSGQQHSWSFDVVYPPTPSEYGVDE